MSTTISKTNVALFGEPAPVPSKRDLTYAEAVKQGLPSTKKSKTTHPTSLMSAFKHAQTTEAAVADDKKSKYYYVVLPKPWVEKALPFSTRVEKAAWKYEQAFERGECDYYAGVSSLVRLAAISAYVKSRADWISFQPRMTLQDTSPQFSKAERSLGAKFTNEVLEEEWETLDWPFEDKAIDLTDDKAEDLEGRPMVNPPNYKLFVRWTNLPNIENQLKICVRMEFVGRDHVVESDHPDISVKALVAAFNGYSPLYPNTAVGSDLVSFLNSVTATQNRTRECWYGFIDVRVADRPVEVRVEDLASHIKKLVQHRAFENDYLCALKTHDEHRLHGILEFGSDWQEQFADSYIKIASDVDLRTSFSGYDLWKVGEAIFGAPSNWPQCVREAFAGVGEENDDSDSDYDGGM
jgi:hypothetical protein